MESFSRCPSRVGESLVLRETGGFRGRPSTAWKLPRCPAGTGQGLYGRLVTVARVAKPSEVAPPERLRRRLN